MGKKLVLETDAAHTGLLELTHEPPCVVKVAEASIAVEQDWNLHGVLHHTDLGDHL